MGKDRQEKPYPGFPLTWHKAGYWCKRINGKVYYFGERWATAEDAYQDYLIRRDNLGERRAATTAPTDGLKMIDLVNYFLEAKERQKEQGELSQRSYNDYFRIGNILVEMVGRNRLVDQMTPQDFGALKTRLVEGVGIQTGANRVRLARIVFRHAEQDHLIEGRIKWGTQFKVVDRKTIRRDRQDQQKTHGARLFTQQQIFDLLGKANVQFRAMILLGLNCGLGNTDISEIMTSHVAGEWLKYPRQKTTVDRMAWLWPETREAVAAVAGDRDGKIFCRRTGSDWVKVSEKCVDDGVAKEFAKLMRAVKHNRPGLSFYTLRHTFQTIADRSKDPVAVSVVMGHVDESMAGRYREEMENSRIRAVCEVVRRWLLEAGKIPASKFSRKSDPK